MKVAPKSSLRPFLHQALQLFFFFKKRVLIPVLEQCNTGHLLSKHTYPLQGIITKTPKG